MAKKTNPEDLELFHAAMKGVRRLTTNTVPPTPKRKKNPRKIVIRPPVVDLTPLNDYDNEEVTAEEPLTFIRPGLQPRHFRSLKNGHLPIEAELDMHGLTVDEAKLRLQKILPRCYERNIRVLHIIHGKGRRGLSDKPILKNKVNTWLRQFDFVIAFCSCTPRDGGNGAVYVLLKRQRADESDEYE
jgi:DNA-nicking Smr family endonuclease